MNTSVSKLHTLILTTSLLGGCAVGEGIADATEVVFRGIAESLVGNPALVRAFSDLRCDAEPMCGDDGTPLASTCELEGALWAEGFAEPFVACALECSEDPCVDRAIADAGLAAAPGVQARCQVATEACEVSTDVCDRMAAFAGPTQQALDECHTRDCESLADCYRDLLLGPLSEETP